LWTNLYVPQGDSTAEPSAVAVDAGGNVYVTGGMTDQAAEEHAHALQRSVKRTVHTPLLSAAQTAIMGTSTTLKAKRGNAAVAPLLGQRCGG
jgi:hypothetical protein